MREFRYPGTAHTYWVLCLLGAIGVFLWLAAYSVYLIDLSMSGWGWMRYPPYALRRLFTQMAKYATAAIPYVKFSATSATVLFCLSALVSYALIVFPLVLLQRRRFTYWYRLEADGIERIGHHKASRVGYAEVRDVRARMARGAVFRTRFDTMAVPLGIGDVPAFLAAARESIAAAGGTFPEAAYLKALDLAAFAKWRLKNGIRLVGWAAVLALALGATGYWMADLLWYRGLPFVAAGAAILLLPIYIAGPWWLAGRRFRGAHRDQWRPPERSFAFWTIFFSAAAAWGTFEALLLLLIF